jgi:hypothetical protein
MTPARKVLFGFGTTVLFLVACGLVAFFRTAAKRPEIVPAGVVPASWSEFRTSHGHEQHVGKSTVTCKDCHGYETTGFANPGAGVCERCHRDQTAHTHAGGAKKTDCLACHSFAPREASTCITCHAEVQGTHARVAQHATVACSECHHPHATPAIAPKTCTSCHEERALSHAAHAGSKDCQDCHRAHEPARAADASCSSCHERPAGPKPAGHDSCMSCHKPHGFTAQAGRVCVVCHGVKPTLVAATAPAHAACTSCHAPHAPGQAAGSCQSCHAQVHVAHAGKEACVGCHEPHRGDVDAKASACTTCHASVASTDQGAHGAHAACTSCHKPHAFPAVPAGQLCADCHAGPTQLASENRGHRECRTCHGASAHQPQRAPPCATCHANEATTAPVGHQTCGSCHESHGGARLPVAATCVGCHAKKAAEQHASIRGGCETCHRAHGPNGVAAPPKCATCHQPPSLPALHAVPAHTDCGKCHTSHGPPRADRETCTGTCHAGRKNHQPGAQVCSGCHVFRN